MKIETGSPIHSVPLEITSRKPVSRAAVEMPSSEDVVKLSSVPFSEVLSSQKEDEIRQAKVAAIRDQLASGNYSISGKDVADRILNALKN